MRRGVLGLAVLALCHCSGGGGGGGRFDDQAQLLAIVFPDPRDVNDEDESTPPSDAPLVQSVEFHFSGRPNPSRINRDAIAIRSPSGFPVPGTFTVDETVIRFTPRLPTRAAQAFSRTSFDNGGAGLEANTAYSVRIGPGSWDFVQSVAPDLLAAYADPGDSRGVLMGFQTTSKLVRFFWGVERRRPRVVSVSPDDGTTGYSPQLYTDPDGRYGVREPIHVTFDGPVNPDPANLERCLLVDIDDRSVDPSGLSLGLDVRVVENEIDRSVIELAPSGILALGHLHTIEVPVDFEGLSQSGPREEARSVVGTFTVADAVGDEVVDALVESFDDQTRREGDPEQFEQGLLLAEWDTRDSNVLQASFAFDGGGELGRFIPSPPPDVSEPRTIILDTSRQAFPLFDGSTPDAPPGFEVVGGVFPFSDIDIPAGVILEVRGPNPLILTATGSVQLSGSIRAAGQRGTDENAFDSAVTSVPGGAAGSGGGRGGEGHPIIYFPPDDISNLTLVSPPYGGRGWGPANAERLGGTGGQSGMLDKPNSNGKYGTDSEIDCLELVSAHNNGYKPPGGGGGSFLKSGKAPERDGISNVLADGFGNYIVRTSDEGSDHDVLTKGLPGDLPFFDSDKKNNFIGTRGEYQTIFGGQGGGSGGSALDSYYCGNWCLVDEDNFNDSVCQGIEFATFAGSVGDARGGSAGGGGGAVQIKSLGEIIMTSTGAIDCRGGGGGGGEMLGCGAWSGGGGGGSGGAVILQSASGITLQDNATIDVKGGGPGLATRETNYAGGGCPGTKRDDTRGAGGRGGTGLIQLQVPLGEVANVDDGANLTNGAWVDEDNTKNPAEFTPISVAMSTWFDLGRAIARGDDGPVFRFRGLDADGFVRTDDDGFVLDPEQTDIVCDYLGQLDPLNPGQYRRGQEPQADFIPSNASVRVEFQGADAVAEGSKEVEPSSLTEWEPTPSVANGHQFLRYRITFDIAAEDDDLGPLTPRPAVQSLRIRSEF